MRFIKSGLLAGVCTACGLGYAPLAVAQDSTAHSLGVDVEFATPLDPEHFSMICTSVELDRITGPDRALHAKLIFSAKEAAFKAQYPLTGQLFGFDHLDATLDLDACSFTAAFLHTTGRFTAGAALEGNFIQVAQHFMTAVTIPHPAWD